jgi:hypothetical protein
MKSRTLRGGGDLLFSPRFPNLEQNHFGTLSTPSHSGQLRALVHHLGGMARGLGRTQTEAIFLRHHSLAVRDECFIEVLNVFVV